MTLKLISALKGGSGSGNFGHAGRPGKVGGSSSIHYAAADPQDLIRYYDLTSNCDVIDCEALNMYTHSGYDVVNRKLRFGSYADSAYEFEWKDAEVNKLLTGLDKSFQNAPTVPSNLIAYRGVNSRLFDNLAVGDSFTDKGFVSTSIDPAQTMSGWQMEIRIPAGTKGIYIEQVSNVASEMELLLNRGTRFRVLEIQRSVNKYGTKIGKAVVQVENDK